MVSKYIGQSYAINFLMRLQKSERHIREIKAVHLDKLYNFPNLLWHLSHYDHEKPKRFTCH